MTASVLEVTPGPDVPWCPPDVGRARAHVPPPTPTSRKLIERLLCYGLLRSDDPGRVALRPEAHVEPHRVSGGFYLRGVRQIFDMAWTELDVGSVERFLADASDEGLTWEAKGKETPRRDSVLKAVCGFANALGGYLIIGAERGSTGWQLPGASFPGDEPATWISSMITAGGVSPVPRFDAKPFPRESGRQAVVVEIHPIATPPCITASGVVYQRVSGQTLPVKDQRVLSDLIEKGAAARSRTEASALRAGQRMLAEAGDFASEHSVLAAALCAVDGPADKAAALFSEDRGRRFADLVNAELQPESVVLSYGVRGSVHQDCLRVWTATKDEGQAVTAAGFWDGAVAVVWSSAENQITVPEITHEAQRFWRTLATAAQLFGGRGEAHFALAINNDHIGLRGPGRELPRTDVRRWTEAREPRSDELDSMGRELERGFGHTSWEPSPSS